MEMGKVKFYLENKGYGFITNDQGVDLFFHVSGIDDPSYIPSIGDVVTYRTTENKRGVCAKDVTHVSE